MAKARLILDDKIVLADGAIIETRIWALPQAVEGSAHRLKYSLFYGYPGRRIVGYDNERGKGDHRHIRGREMAYRFVSMEKLIEDFLADVEAAGGKL